MANGGKDNIMLEWEEEYRQTREEANYYRKQLAKSHELLGRMIHQLSERWDHVNLTEYFPTDNLFGKRKSGNPTGKKNDKTT